MTAATLSSVMAHFSREQLEAIDKILELLDPEEFRDYHGQFGVCNAPDVIEILRDEVKIALAQFDKKRGETKMMAEPRMQIMQRQNLAER